MAVYDVSKLSLPPFCASPTKIPPIFVPSHLTLGTAILPFPGLHDLLEEKDGSDVDAEAAALMLELRGAKKKQKNET